MLFESEIDEFEDEAPTYPGLRELRARILVVEDDEHLRELIVTRMRREAFDVVEAGSGYEALEVLDLVARGATADDLDLLVMDVRMPGTSGLEIARMLRAAHWTVPVLLITAFPDREVISEAARLKLSLLAKPFALDRMSDAAIAAILGPQRRALV